MSDETPDALTVTLSLEQWRVVALAVHADMSPWGDRGILGKAFRTITGAVRRGEAMVAAKEGVNGG